MTKARILVALLWLLLVQASPNATADDENVVPDPNTNGALPGDFPEFIIIQNSETAPGYLAGSVNSAVEGVGSYFLIMDNAGIPVFYSTTQSLGQLMCNGLFAYRREITGQTKKYTWFLKDAEFNEVDSFQMGNGYLADSHDFQLLPNGHVLMLCYDTQTIDMSAIVEGGHPAAEVVGAVIQELDVDRNVIFQWRSWDHIPIVDSYRDITRKKFGYIHVNSVEFDETDGNIILSCRETSEVVKISRATGQVMWRLGGKHNEFTFVNEHEENAPRYFKLQHDVRRHANGNLTLFDNGLDKRDKSRDYSRGVAYALDEENRTATLVWEFRHDPDIAALTGGNVTVLPNGNTVIRWGGAAKEGEAPAMTEVDPDGQLVYEIWPAQEGVTGGFNRIAWPLEELTTTVTQYELMEGNRYVFNDDDAATGVTVKVNSYEGEGYNEVYVTCEPFAPLHPEFPGKAPRVLPVRMTITPWEISGMNADLAFDAEHFGFADRTGQFGYADPNQLTIYHRPYKGYGLFLPLPTNYNYVTKQLRTTMTQFGEFIFCFPDLEEVPLAPILIAPGNQGTVNQELPVPLSWTPAGLARAFHLQISRDSDFTVLDVDEADLVEARYRLEAVAPGTQYYWRVNTFNHGGTGDWSTGSFTTVEPMVRLTAPQDGVVLQRGLEYFVTWADNIDEDVVIDLVRGDALVERIDTVSSIGAYAWEVSLALDPGDDYAIRITSTVNETVSDSSDTVFSIE
ncbi:MAG: aryl-sulfate sulfotransferase [Phycisphaerales bacterium]|nr:MAG: aryl-sulfate sulfotransferase [Phycisphaerales bacterium]